MADLNALAVRVQALEDIEASRLQRAAVKGELDRLEIDPKLLARKEEFEAFQRRKPEEMKAFLNRMTTELRGRRIFITGATFGGRGGA
jgi:hypothetical protein